MHDCSYFTSLECACAEIVIKYSRNIFMGNNVFIQHNHINDFLMGDEPASLKDLCLKLLLIIATGLDNVSQNMLPRP